MSKKIDRIIPIGRQQYAYQCEPVSTVCSIKGSIPYQRGSEPYPNKEAESVREYHLEIIKFTQTSLTVQLTKVFKDGSKTMYQTGMSFAQLANQIFSGVEVSEFQYDKEGNIWMSNLLNPTQL